MKLGDRVMHKDDGVGHITAIDKPWPDGTILVDVRWLTPLNVPSVLTSTTDSRHLMVVPDSVKPEARSREWMEKAQAFCAAIEAALRESDEPGGQG